MEIGPKVTTLGRRRNFVVKKIDLGGGEMKLDSISIRSVKIHTLEPLRTDTNCDVGDRAAAATTTTNGDTTITDPVSMRVFKAPASEPLNG